jgi:drug/metabolite transporter (DMT)-like permease
MEFYAYIVAAGTACCWSVTSMTFAVAGKRIGSMKVNQIRIIMAVVFLSLCHYLVFGRLWPVNATSHQLYYLALSGIVGLFLGDMCYFASLVIIGPKRATVMMTVSPASCAITAWLLMGEGLHVFTVIGMAVTIAGIAVTVSAGKKKDIAAEPVLKLALGITLGLLGGIGQGAGIAIAKMGLKTIDPATGAVIDEFDPLSGTLIRMVAAAFMLWLVVAGQEALSGFRGKPSGMRKAFGDRRAMMQMLLGAFVGPFIGVWASLFAVKHGQAAVAMTIIAMFPILVIPQAAIIYKERPRLQEIAGAAVAILGIAILFSPQMM